MENISEQIKKFEKKVTHSPLMRFILYKKFKDLSEPETYRILNECGLGDNAIKKEVRNIFQEFETSFSKFSQTPTTLKISAETFIEMLREIEQHFISTPLYTI